MHEVKQYHMQPRLDIKLLASQCFVGHYCWHEHAWHCVSVIYYEFGHSSSRPLGILESRGTNCFCICVSVSLQAVPVHYVVSKPWYGTRYLSRLQRDAAGTVLNEQNPANNRLEIKSTHILGSKTLTEIVFESTVTLGLLTAFNSDCPPQSMLTKTVWEPHTVEIS